MVLLKQFWWEQSADNRTKINQWVWNYLTVIWSWIVIRFVPVAEEWEVSLFLLLGGATRVWRAEWGNLWRKLQKIFSECRFFKTNLIWEFVLYLFVGANCLISLKDHENFKSFDILTENNDPSTLTRSEEFLLISEDLGNGHYWLEAKAVARLSLEYEDKDWIKSYWEMLAKAEPFGYFDPIKCQIKAHLVE